MKINLLKIADEFKEGIEMPIECNWCTFISNDMGDFLVDSKGKFGCYGCLKKCDICDKTIDFYEGISYDNKWWCPDCYNEKFTTCYLCDKIFEKEDAIEIYLRNKGLKQLCENCAEENYFKCESCNEWIDRNYAYSYEDDLYCEICHSSLFEYCERCNEAYPKDDLIYIENDNTSFCEYCFDKKYIKCKDCKEPILRSNKDEYVELGDNYYCLNCYSKDYSEIFKGINIPEKFEFNVDFSIPLSILKRILNKNKGIIPINKLKSENSQLFTVLQNLLSKQGKNINELSRLTGGKNISIADVLEFEKTLISDEHAISQKLWAGAQRSAEDLDRPQLVLIIKISDKMREEIVEKDLLDTFKKVIKTSDKSGHPTDTDMIGWIRIDIDDEKKYILIDEIQSDFMASLGQLRKYYKKHYDMPGQFDYSKLNNFELDAFKKIEELTVIFKNFPNIAMHAAAEFARQNNIPKIYYHTYEGGKKLKYNNPPRELYTDLPRKTFFNPSEEAPFGLNTKFFERESRMILDCFIKVAKMLKD